jgi:hypothetical protein
MEIDNGLDADTTEGRLADILDRAKDVRIDGYHLSLHDQELMANGLRKSVRVVSKASRR